MSRKRQSGATRTEWLVIALMLALIVAIGGGVLVDMHLKGEKARVHMESAAVPLIEALDRYRAANKSYPDKLANLVPTYLPDVPACNPQAANPGMAYYVDKVSGEYTLNCGIGMFTKRQYSSRTRKWTSWN
jgi:hypothetical protein